MLTITSLQNERIKTAIKLRDRKGREQQGRIVIDGVRELRRAAESQIDFVEAFICEELCHSEESRAVAAILQKISAEVFHVTPAVFEKLAYGQRLDGVLGVAHSPQRSLDDLELPPQALVAVLDGIEKPGNVGAVLRSADGAGIAAVIVAEGGTDLYNPNVIRASLGTIFTVPVCEASAEETLAWLRNKQFSIFTARVDGATDYSLANFRAATAFVLGAEDTGLSDTWHGADIRPIKLPMLGSADSLNVSATAAVLFYEAVRQRTANGR